MSKSDEITTAKMFLAKVIHDKVRSIMEERDISQAKAAAMIDFRADMLSSVMCGRVERFKLDTLMGLAMKLSSKITLTIDEVEKELKIANSDEKGIDLVN